MSKRILRSELVAGKSNELRRKKAVKAASERGREKYNARFSAEVPKLHQIAEYKEEMIKSLRRSEANERAWISRKKALSPINLVSLAQRIREDMAEKREDMAEKE